MNQCTIPNNAEESLNHVPVAGGFDSKVVRSLLQNILSQKRFSRCISDLKTISHVDLLSFKDDLDEISVSDSEKLLIRNKSHVS